MSPLRGKNIILRLVLLYYKLLVNLFYYVCLCVAALTTAVMAALPVTSKVGKVIDNIIKSPEDKRLYRGLQLKNGMKLLLISDATADKSAAALDVHIGM